MSDRFVIEIDWERLDSGPAEERATFGAIGVRIGETWLTEAHDSSVNWVRQKVHLSGYLLAQWLAWNWWRLLCEPQKPSLAWAMAHRMTTIGGGYVWPNIRFVTDGAQVLLDAHPTPLRPAEPLRYVAEVTTSTSASEFECGAEGFLGQIVQKLRTEGIRDSNLEHIWADVCEERRDRESNFYRRLEAAIGFDPDEAPEQMVKALICDSGELGENAVAELAANASPESLAPDSTLLRELAVSSGHDAKLTDIPSLEAGDKSEVEGPAWSAGEATARALRIREKLDEGQLSNKILVDLAGTSPTTLEPDTARAPFSFSLNGEGSRSRIVLQSPFVTNRRFAVARLIGDVLFQQSLYHHTEPLTAALRSYTYRQKFQRAFAAELLCPFDQVMQLLGADLSDENQERVAAEYAVSPMLIRTQLTNKRLLPRDNFEIF